jgi:hypothetical protein
MSKKITEMFAFVITNEDGIEGITGMLGPDNEWVPLVGADMARVESLKVIAQHISDQCGQQIRIMKFTGHEQIGEVNPKVQSMNPWGPL